MSGVKGAKVMVRGGLRGWQHDPEPPIYMCGKPVRPVHAARGLHVGMP